LLLSGLFELPFQGKDAKLIFSLITRFSPLDFSLVVSIIAPFEVLTEFRKYSIITGNWKKFGGLYMYQQTYDSDFMQLEGNQRPAIQLPTNRSMLKMVLLGMITLGIYPLIIMSKISDNINSIASKHDSKKTMNFLLLVFIVGPFTLGIGYLVWYHRISDRIGRDLLRRNLAYSLSSGTFWFWNVLGAIIVVGPFVYLHKLCKAMNYLATDYNQKG
jgi:hypothetical protein